MLNSCSNIFLSVVIPAYNAEQTLKSCIDSILCQNSDFLYEIVIVNDGSKDETATILNDYASKFTNIKVIYQQNSGVTSARKKGIEISSGEWITFVDADDNLPPKTFAKYANACRQDYDIIVGEIDEQRKPHIVTNEEYRYGMIKSTINPSPCAKVFRKHLFDNHVFNIPREIRYGEDLLMNVRLAFKTAKPIYFLGEIVYIVNRYSSSASHTFIKTPDYEEKYSNLLLNSIPEPFRSNHRYMFAVLSLKINGWKTLNFLKLSTKENRDTNFYRHLTQTLIDTNYPLTWKERIQLYGNSLPMRLIAIYLNLYPVIVYRFKRLKKRIKF